MAKKTLSTGKKLLLILKRIRFYNEKQNKDVYMVVLRDDTGELIGYYEKHEYRNREMMERYDYGDKC